MLLIEQGVLRLIMMMVMRHITILTWPPLSTMKAALQHGGRRTGSMKSSRVRTVARRVQLVELWAWRVAPRFSFSAKAVATFSHGHVFASLSTEIAGPLGRWPVPRRFSGVVTFKAISTRPSSRGKHPDKLPTAQRGGAGRFSKQGPFGSPAPAQRCSIFFPRRHSICVGLIARPTPLMPDLLNWSLAIPRDAIPVARCAPSSAVQSLILAFMVIMNSAASAGCAALIQLLSRPLTGTVSVISRA